MKIVVAALIVLLIAACMTQVHHAPLPVPPVTIVPRALP